MKRRNRKSPYPGVLARLEQESIIKYAAPDRLKGFWRSPRKRRVFVPLGTKTGFLRC